jgi:tRNA(Ile)-lysidine synthetase-like protein
MYHCRVHPLAQRVLSQIRRQQLMRAGDRVAVAVSGGIDSISLLRLVLELRHELGIVLSVVHFNHKLRGAESDADHEFIAQLARRYDLEFYSDSDDVAQHAAEEHISVETAARELRYGFFRYLLESGESGAVPSRPEAQIRSAFANRSAESAAPHESAPQGLKADSSSALNGTAEAVPFHESSARESIKHTSTRHTSGEHTSPWHESHDREFAAENFEKNETQGGGLSTGSSELASAHLNTILTGHTLDDQAETVLMRMIRGSGVRGLGGIHPRIVVEEEDGEFSGEILRPLLAIRRRELEQYLNDIGQTWREDSSNAEDRFTRNRVRKLVVPLLEHEFNPAVAENLAELAEIARGEEDYWDNEVSGWLGTTVQWSEPDWARAASQRATLVQIAPLSGKASVCSDEHEPPSDIRPRIDNAHWLVMNASVSRIWFLGEPVAVQRRLVKAVGEHARIPLEFKHIEEILRAAAADEASGKELSLPLGWKLVVEPEQLVFVTPDLRDAVAPKDYEYELRVPGEVMVYEAGSSIEVLLVPAGAEAGYNLDHLLDSRSLPGPLRVRNWRPGERFWPAHTKSPKKIKELLQERHIAQPQRRLWPVVVSGNEIVWMRGFSPPAKLLAAPGRAGVAIVDKPLPARLTTGL